MKTYFRLLSFAKPIEKFAIPYIICVLLYVLFSTLQFPLLIPLLSLLFSPNSGNVVHHAAARPAEALNIMGWFNYYVEYFINTYGKWEALEFVCGIIMVTIVLGNLFRYLSARVMENLRVHT